MSVIGGVGFFHFVANRWEDPFGSLESRLKTDLPDRLPDRDFLIVLPEAFNFGADFNDREPKQPRVTAKGTLVRLAEFSRMYVIVFVTSLLEAADDRVNSQHLNSAYLVDSDLSAPVPWRLLCHKKSFGGHQHYKPCPDEPTNCCNPSCSKGVYVGALICNDAHADVAMMERLRECSSLKLLCVPAWMDQHSFRDPSAGTAGPYWVLANSHPSGCGSFITNREGWKVEQIKNTEKDCLVVKTWDELNARSGPTTVI